MTTALFAGSFDPFTNGHLNTIERAVPLFDRLIVAIATNTSKTSLFTFEEKQDLIWQEVKDLGQIDIIQLKDDLTVKKAKALGVDVLLRGVRNSIDYEYEADIAHMNKYLEANIETLLMVAHPRLSYVSSSLIKEVVQFGGDVSDFVPDRVATALQEKYK